jgi:hypothetical protein
MMNQSGVDSGGQQRMKQQQPVRHNDRAPAPACVRDDDESGVDSGGQRSG